MRTCRWGLDFDEGSKLFGQVRVMRYNLGSIVRQLAEKLAH